MELVKINECEIQIFSNFKALVVNILFTKIQILHYGLNIKFPDHWLSCRGG